MALIKDTTFRNLAVPGAIHRVRLGTEYDDGTQGISILTHEPAGELLEGQFGIRFTPDYSEGAENNRRQAYLALVAGETSPVLEFFADAVSDEE